MLLGAYMALLRVGFGVFFVLASLSELGNLDLFTQAYRASSLDVQSLVRSTLPSNAWETLAAIDLREAVRYSALCEMTLAVLLLMGPGPALLLATLRAAKMLVVVRMSEVGAWESVLAAVTLVAAAAALQFGPSSSSKRKR